MKEARRGGSFKTDLRLSLPDAGEKLSNGGRWGCLLGGRAQPTVRGHLPNRALPHTALLELGRSCEEGPNNESWPAVE